jgi:F0F1-type ATP synthase membrane subunit b/b'
MGSKADQLWDKARIEASKWAEQKKAEIAAENAAIKEKALKDQQAKRDKVNKVSVEVAEVVEAVEEIVQSKPKKRKGK